MKRRCYVILEGQRNSHGYIPSVVTEGETGHHPMMGNGAFSQPWYWGTDFETAQRLCADANRSLGLSEFDVEQIVTSSIRASFVSDANDRDYAELLNQ